MVIRVGGIKIKVNKESLRNLLGLSCEGRRLNFVMMFITVLVECTKNGRMKEDILRYFYPGTNFKHFDWCDFIIEKTKGCKAGWMPYNKRSLFTAPLTIPTLLYVENFECKGIKLDPRKQAISFWTKVVLKRRERLEIRDGGFGKGRLKELVGCEEKDTAEAFYKND
ncbi:hypothetical protein R6Q57_002944 [Mikania cordata]